MQAHGTIESKPSRVLHLGTILKLVFIEGGISHRGSDEDLIFSVITQ